MASRIFFAVGSCSLGLILLARSDSGICAVFLGDDPAALVQDLQRQFPGAELLAANEDLGQLLEQVRSFVESPGDSLDVKLDVRGTAFQQRVWQALREIPAGKTVTYTDVAHMIGAPKAVRAVAQACGANTLAVVIPCHRVVRSDGNLAGYRWGVERKRALLRNEQAESSFFSEGLNFPGAAPDET